MFVESVLRFGLPVNFQGMMLLPQKKTSKKLRDTLNQLYTHLDSALGAAGAEVRNGPLNLCIDTFAVHVLNSHVEHVHGRVHLLL